MKSSFEGETYMRDKILLDNKHIKHSACASVDAGTHIIEVDEDNISEYVNKPVKSFRNPMYKLCCPHL